MTNKKLTKVESNELRVLAQKLLNKGIDPTTIADTLNIEVIDLVRDLEDDMSDLQLEKAIPRARLDLIWKSLRITNDILDNGTMTHKISVIKSMLTPVIRNAKFEVENESSGSVIINQMDKFFSLLSPKDDEDEIEE